MGLRGAAANRTHGSVSVPAAEAVQAVRPARSVTKRDVTVVSFPPAIRQNPYQRLLYNHLEPPGVSPPGRDAPVDSMALEFARDRARASFHWPQGYVRRGHASRRLTGRFRG